MNMHSIPREGVLGEILFPPGLAAIAIGVLAALCVGWVLNRTGLARSIWYPSLFLLALSVIFTWLAGILFMPF
jgi:hypothetical protein